jgi:MoxR-like ATPase
MGPESKKTKDITDMTTNLNAWTLLDTAIKHLRVVCVCGKPGIGKTFTAQGGNNPTDAISLNLSEDTVVQELFGHYVPKGNEFVYHDGPVVTAFREGKTLVINELSRASGAVKDALLAILDSKESARITLADGETVHANKNFRAVITSNDSADDLDPALRDRCECVINLIDPHPGLIEALNSAWAGLGDAVKDSWKDQTRAISTRASFAYAKLRNAGVPQDTAAILAYSERAKDITDTLKLRGVQ